jgi:hypothetical protein
MAWRLYDVQNGQWYNDMLYESRETCVQVAHVYMQEAHAVDEVLELLAEPFDPSDIEESLMEEEP